MDAEFAQLLEIFRRRALEPDPPPASTPAPPPARTAEAAEPPAAAVDPWPVLGEAAYSGLAGEIVQAIGPTTEADPVALLAALLSEFSCMIGRGPHLIVGSTYHPLTIWPVLVGRTAKARKGTASSCVGVVCRAADPTWTRGRYRGTLSSGEGLVYAVRDAASDDQTRTTDRGVDDKRLYLVQPEWGSVLRILSRDGNSLSGVLRDAWDGMDLAPLTKHDRIRATAPHVVILGHVTVEELRRSLTDTEACNGFGNRFLYLLVRRSKLLPWPGEVRLDAALTKRLQAALENARTVGRLSVTPNAYALWEKSYPDLSAEMDGLVGALLARTEPYALRLAGLYALLNGGGVIDAPHLHAAMAVMDYAAASVTNIWGDATGDPVADAILEAVRRQGSLTDSQISDLFARNVPATRLIRAKQLLIRRGLVVCEEQHTGGRRRQVWRPKYEKNEKSRGTWKNH